MSEELEPWAVGDKIDWPCGHAEPQAASQVHGVCVFCWRDRCGMLEHKRSAADAEIARLREANAALERCVRDLDVLVSESKGVYGLHLNGDESPWDELTGDGYMSEWLGSLDKARAALAPQAGEKGEGDGW